MIARAFSLPPHTCRKEFITLDSETLFVNLLGRTTLGRIFDALVCKLKISCLSKLMSKGSEIRTFYSQVYFLSPSHIV